MLGVVLLLTTLLLELGSFFQLGVQAQKETNTLLIADYQSELGQQLFCQPSFLSRHLKPD